MGGMISQREIDFTYALRSLCAGSTMKVSNGSSTPGDASEATDGVSSDPDPETDFANCAIFDITTREGRIAAWLSLCGVLVLVLCVVTGTNPFDGDERPRMAEVFEIAKDMAKPLLVIGPIFLALLARKWWREWNDVSNAQALNLSPGYVDPSKCIYIRNFRRAQPTAALPPVPESHRAAAGQPARGDTKAKRA